MKNRILALAIICIPSLAWAEIDTSWYNNSNCEFVISNEAQLRGLAQLTREGQTFAFKKIKLSNDIVIDDEDPWRPIGYPLNSDQTVNLFPFLGCFDGAGYTITLKSDFDQYWYVYNEYGEKRGYIGFFGMIGPDGKVENLILDIGEKNIVVDQEDYNCDTGMLAGSCFGKIDACETRGKLSFSWDKYNYSNIGGLVGMTGSKSVIRNCVNKVSMTVRRGSCVGGIAGRAIGMVIDKCVNEGSVKLFEATGDGSGLVAGGIVGSFLGERACVGMISNCLNKSEIASDSKAHYCGGISGWFGGTALLVNCGNTGSIISDASSVGGISGYAREGDLRNCYNAAKVESSRGIRLDALVENEYENPTDNCYFCKEYGKSKFGEKISETEMTSGKLINQLNLYAKQLNNFVEDFLERETGEYIPTILNWQQGSDNNGFPEF